MVLFSNRARMQIPRAKGTAVALGRYNLLIREAYNVQIENNDQQTIETTDRARQGVTGHNVRYVLIFGLTGVIAAFLVVFLVLGH
jgi:hypothetical protein